MIIKKGLDRIKEIVRGFKNQNRDERLISYTIIVTILNQIEETVKDKYFPNYKIYKQSSYFSKKISENLCSSLRPADLYSSFTIVG